MAHHPSRYANQYQPTFGDDFPQPPPEPPNVAEIIRRERVEREDRRKRQAAQRTAYVQRAMAAGHTLKAIAEGLRELLHLFHGQGAQYVADGQLRWKREHPAPYRGKVRTILPLLPGEAPEE